ncbi:hypothetical protein PRZ48_009308 [Zasmidium cellare]|uniref:BTB domain-containing protein n=1 Tax=Zasmidium cellare TaxID=395010 RepID=A0ABR0EC59_ZASCE|nr:hypothetical protein PRZ48_009308 [Zasmidium cellare]
MAADGELPTTTCLEGAIPVLSGLAACLRTTELSDFAIESSAGTIAVHRIILSLHSKVLRKACNGDFRETSEAFIDLHHENPACVQAMVEFLYHFDYDFPEGEPTSVSAFHVQMAVIADKYDIAALKDAAFIKCRASLPSTANQADAFAETIDLAYENIVALPDLCKHLVAFALDNPAVGVSAEFHPSLKKVMQKHPDLAMNIAEAMHIRLMEKPKLDPDVKAYVCPDCAGTSIFRTDLVHARIYPCKNCSFDYYGHQWRKTKFKFVD